MTTFTNRFSLLAQLAEEDLEFPSQEDNPKYDSWEGDISYHSKSREEVYYAEEVRKKRKDPKTKIWTRIADLHACDKDFAMFNHPRGSSLLAAVEKIGFPRQVTSFGRGGGLTTPVMEPHTQLSMSTTPCPPVRHCTSWPPKLTTNTRRT